MLENIIVYLKVESQIAEENMTCNIYKNIKE